MISRLVCLVALLGCSATIEPRERDDSDSGGTSEGGGASGDIPGDPCYVSGDCAGGMVEWQCPEGPIGPPMGDGDVCSSGGAGRWCCAPPLDGCALTGATCPGGYVVACTTRLAHDTFGPEHGCAAWDGGEAWCCDG